MIFEIDVDGRPRAVSVELASPGRYRLVIDSRPYMVDARRIGEFGWSLLVDETAMSRDVQVTPGTARGEVLVSLDGRTIAVTVNGRRLGRVDSAGQADGEQTIVAPMPGRIVRVLAGTGDHVSAHQPIVVVEAMKMENELRSPKAGRVKEITVTTGTSVEAGRVLAIIE